MDTGNEGYRTGEPWEKGTEARVRNCGGRAAQKTPSAPDDSSG